MSFEVVTVFYTRIVTIFSPIHPFIFWCRFSSFTQRILLSRFLSCLIKFFFIFVRFCVYLIQLKMHTVNAHCYQTHTMSSEYQNGYFKILWHYLTVSCSSCSYENGKCCVKQCQSNYFANGQKRTNFRDVWEGEN